MDKYFPRDCEGCKNYLCYDMSIDDYTNVCSKHKWQVDDCDLYGVFGGIHKRLQENCYGDCK